MVDMSESQEGGQHPSELYRQGRDKPVDVEGHTWVPVKGLDPTKPPGEISGWRGVPLPTRPPDEFVIPPETQAEEQRRVETEVGVGSFAARTEAGMRRAEERAEIKVDAQEKPQENE